MVGGTRIGAMALLTVESGRYVWRLEEECRGGGRTRASRLASLEMNKVAIILTVDLSSFIILYFTFITRV
jgi:hypothetical protein